VGASCGEALRTLSLRKMRSIRSRENPKNSANSCLCDKGAEVL
jgi:hypothetical protein